MNIAGETALESGNSADNTGRSIKPVLPKMNVMRHAAARGPDRPWVARDFASNVRPGACWCHGMAVMYGRHVVAHGSWRLVSAKPQVAKSWQSRHVCRCTLQPIHICQSMPVIWGEPLAAAPGCQFHAVPSLLGHVLSHPKGNLWYLVSERPRFHPAIPRLSSRRDRIARVGRPAPGSRPAVRKDRACRP